MKGNKIKISKNLKKKLQKFLFDKLIWKSTLFFINLLVFLINDSRNINEMKCSKILKFSMINFRLKSIRSELSIKKIWFKLSADNDKWQKKLTNSSRIIFRWFEF